MRASRSILSMIVASTLVVAACGDDDASSEPSGPTGTAEPTAADDAPTETAEPDTDSGDTGGSDAPATVDDTSGEDSATDEPSADDQAGAQAVADAEAAAAGNPMQAEGEPIVIGFQNPEGDPNGSFPEFTIGAEAAVQYINEELGGVGADYEAGTPGRPIELEVCKMAIDPADSQRCANELAGAEPFAVISPLNFFGNHFAIYQAAGVPMLIGAPVSINDFTSPNAYAIGDGGGCLGMDTGRLDFMTRVLGLRKIAVGYIDTAPGQVCYNNFDKQVLEVLAGERMDGSAMEADGNSALGTMPDLTHTGVAFAPGGADMTPGVTQLLEFEPDGISFSGQLSDCWTFIDTLTKLGWSANDTPLAMGSGCIDINRLEELGDAAAGITYVGAQSVADPSALTGQLKSEAETYLAKMEQYAEDGAEVASKGFTAQGFGLVMTFWEMANEQVAGDPSALSPDGFSEVMAATDDHHAYLGAGISCADGVDAAPYVAVCSTAVAASEWNGETLETKETDFSGFYLLEGTDLAATE
jgi:branched-chain amino acid transport system substrate-binding protein